MTDALAPARRFCTAPMMSHSHKHARQLWRLLCPPALIYTEMLMADALVFGKRAHLLDAAPLPAPVALQLGGNDPARMAAAAKIGEDAGYAEININCGCPSARVRKGAFGACLMQQPALVGELVRAVKDAVRLPVTVKCRIAVDGMDAEAGLDEFAGAVAGAGAAALIVHARRAWLCGLNPAQNRSVPPLDYARVHRLKRAFPALQVVLNGGIRTLDEAAAQLEVVDGVMLGREVCRRPYILAEAGARFFGIAAVEKAQVFEEMRGYIATVPARERRWALSALSGLYHGEAHSRRYRQSLHAGEVLPPASLVTAA